VIVDIRYNVERLFLDAHEVVASIRQTKDVDTSSLRHLRTTPQPHDIASYQSTVPDPTGISLILSYPSFPGGQWLARRALVVVMITL